MQSRAVPQSGVQPTNLVSGRGSLMRNARRYVTLSVLFCALCAQGMAQTITGSISGTLTDDSGAIVPDTEVSIHNELTGEIRKTKTAATGEFLVSALQPGRYTVAVDKTGFKRLRVTGLTLTANQRLVVGPMTLTL